MNQVEGRPEGVSYFVAPAVHADEHAGAMYMTMTVMRPGLFFQREEPGSEPGNSLVRPDGHM